jgi:hypothetical protein
MIQISNICTNLSGEGCGCQKMEMHLITNLQIELEQNSLSNMLAANYFPCG